MKPNSHEPHGAEATLAVFLLFTLCGLGIGVFSWFFFALQGTGALLDQL